MAPLAAEATVFFSAFFFGFFARGPANRYCWRISGGIWSLESFIIFSIPSSCQCLG